MSAKVAAHGRRTLSPMACNANPSAVKPTPTSETASRKPRSPAASAAGLHAQEHRPSLPRILNSRSACLRALWTMAVLVFFGFLLYNIVSLSIDLSGEATVVMMWTPWTPRPPFPSVTVCDASQQQHDRRFSAAADARDYAQRIRELAANQSDDNLTAYLEELLTPMAYHDQLDADVVPGFSLFNNRRLRRGEAYRLVLHILLDSDTDSVHGAAMLNMLDAEIDIGNGLRLSPGTQSCFVHVEVKQTVYQRGLSRCDTELLDLYISGRQWRVKYTTDLCTYLGRHDTYKNLTPSSNRLDLTHLTCLMQLDGKLLPKRESQASLAATRCALRSASRWPRSEAKGIDANSALDFFQRYVFNTSAHRLMQDRLEVYATALQLRSAGRDAEGVFQFNSNQARAKKVTENYILGLSAFISQIGGLLSLFSGSL
uniref:Transmembrane protein n=1 Tax=Macrostomum lignano TaxID=282301 RepID=A0A1I8FN19_9PLAT